MVLKYFSSHTISPLATFETVFEYLCKISSGEIHFLEKKIKDYLHMYPDIAKKRIATVVGQSKAQCRIVDKILFYLFFHNVFAFGFGFYLFFIRFS